jgi:hypothetical protein
MATYTFQFVSTKSANWDQSTPSGDANCHLNIDEGMDAPNEADFVKAFSGSNHGYWYIDPDDVPTNVGTVTSIAIQFHHNGTTDAGNPSCDIILYQTREPLSPIELDRKTINLTTSGFTASQVVFDGLSLTRSQILAPLGVYWDMHDVGGSPGEDPPAYEEW